MLWSDVSLCQVSRACTSEDSKALFRRLRYTGILEVPPWRLPLQRMLMTKTQLFTHMRACHAAHSLLAVHAKRELWGPQYHPRRSY